MNKSCAAVAVVAAKVEEVIKNLVEECLKARQPEGEEKGLVNTKVGTARKKISKQTNKIVMIKIEQQLNNNNNNSKKTEFPLTHHHLE